MRVIGGLMLNIALVCWVLVAASIGHFLRTTAKWGSTAPGLVRR